MADITQSMVERFLDDLFEKDNIQARTVWDPNLQIHHTLKRPMTEKQTQDYIRLINNGMKMNEALMTLRLI